MFLNTSFYYVLKRSNQLAKFGMRPADSPKSATTNRDRKELRVTKMVLIMILTFLIVWSPYAIAVIFTVSKVRNCLKHYLRKNKYRRPSLYAILRICN